MLGVLKRRGATNRRGEGGKGGEMKGAAAHYDVRQTQLFCTRFFVACDSLVHKQIKRGER
jgi:hypothetical protein